MKIRYYGHVGQRTGYGHAANHLCLALQRAGVDLEIRPLAPPDHVNLSGSTLPLAKCLRGDRELSVNPDIVIVHTLPGDCGRVLEIATTHAIEANAIEHLKSAKTVAYTTWEASDAPYEVVGPLAVFDAVWSPSTVSLRGLSTPPPYPLGAAEKTGKPEYRVLPHCFDEETLGMRRDRSMDAGQRPFTFYYVGAWNGRKNVRGIIKAYVDVFRTNDKVRLMISSHGTNQQAFIAAIHACGIPAKDMPRIEFGNQYVADDEMTRFVRDDCDVFVTASRGEAWNLPAFEAMLAGRHIIVPRGQGSDEYLSPDWYAGVRTSADRYEYHRTFAELDVAITPGPKDRPDMYGLSVVGAQGLTCRTLWHEPDLLDLSQMMRHAYDERRRSLTCHYNPIERYGYAAVAKQALGYLECL